MTFIVHGATGAQGSPVLTALLAAGKPAVAATRQRQALPDGTAGVAVDYADPGSLASAYRGAEGVFVHLPLGDPAQLVGFARAIGEALAQARPARVVVSTSGAVVSDVTSPLYDPGSSAVALVAAVAASGVPFAVIEPRLFLENLLLPPVIDRVRSHGRLRYPLRADFPVSWSSHLDVADAVVALLTRPDIDGTVGIGQLPPLTGTDLATALGAHLGYPVEYEPLIPEDFGRLIEPIVGPGAAAVVDLYIRLGGLDGHKINAERSAQQLLGVTPRPIGQWLAAGGVQPLTGRA
ncbi:MAG: NAD(P)H-binding protein [Propionibacteriaceae bacterium]|nr:NAD(P)H-binding protein [Propionibacteriaceae bacterium]